MRIVAGKFKAECFKLMDEVNRTREDIIMKGVNTPG